MALDDRKGVWKSGKGKGRRHTPKAASWTTRHGQRSKHLLGDRTAARRPVDRIFTCIKFRTHFGHLSAAHLRALAEEMRLSMAEVYEVATFYAHFDVVKEGETPPPALTIRVCDSLSCELAGAQQLKAALEDGLDPDEVRVSARAVHGALRHRACAGTGAQSCRQRNARQGRSGDQSSDDTHARYPGVRRPMRSYRRQKAAMRPSKTCAPQATGKRCKPKSRTRICAALGGAGFPSGTKWGFVRANAGPRYLAVNGDEGEPGTFKDRYYLERTPHLFLEGMLIAAWAVRGRHSLYLHARRISGGP